GPGCLRSERALPRRLAHAPRAAATRAQALAQPVSTDRRKEHGRLAGLLRSARTPRLRLGARAGRPDGALRAPSQEGKKDGKARPRRQRSRRAPSPEPLLPSKLAREARPPTVRPLPLAEGEGCERSEAGRPTARALSVSRCLRVGVTTIARGPLRTRIPEAPLTKEWVRLDVHRPSSAARFSSSRPASISEAR